MEAIKMFKWLWRYGKPMWLMSILTLAMYWFSLYVAYAVICMGFLDLPTWPVWMYLAGAVAGIVGLSLLRSDDDWNDRFLIALQSGNRDAMSVLAKAQAKSLKIEVIGSAVMSAILLSLGCYIYY